GSVKDLEVTEPPTKEKMGIGRFHFSDRYSVFDWGEMPDHIEWKGACLCIMGAYCFEELERRGVRTHYRGVVTQDGRLVKTDELQEPTNIMEIDLVRVIHPKVFQRPDGVRYDYYSVYKAHLTNFLIPLEIIYRNSLPQGSSIFKRLKNEEISLSGLGLDRIPKEGEDLEEPIFDISTKLEPQDRYLSWQEAKKLICLNDSELREIKERLNLVNDLITEIAAKACLKNEDGKIEIAFDPKRELMVVDVIGTLDECRFTFKDLHVSKEVARQYYKKTEWYTHLLVAKDEAKAKGIKDWKSLCKSSPPKLDPRLKEIISNMYKATTIECTSLHLFKAPPLSYIIEEYKDYLDREERWQKI
ncbi:MAG: phosphoribosylaminoimidazolesuccinocarboxamide synthase, partial [bacterium]|nr:phosphoribosylaminoimidazolesuccinocarboxamide synthase [bacterium]